MFQTRAQIEQSLSEAGVSQHGAQKLASFAKPCIVLAPLSVKSESEIAIGATKTGGSPDLAPATPWPCRPAYSHAGASLDKILEATNRLREDHTQALADGDQHADSPAIMEATIEKMIANVRLEADSAELNFIAQVDLETITVAGDTDPDIPTAGRLIFFYDTVVQPWGFKPGDYVGSKVIYDTTENSKLIRTTAPPGTREFLPLAYKYRACLSPVSPGDYNSPIQLPDDPDYDAFGEWWQEFVDDFGEAHQISGNPITLQSEMQSECMRIVKCTELGDLDNDPSTNVKIVQTAPTDWLLLAQFGSHYNDGAMWGDNGRLYIWITRDDLKARRFEKAWSILQCR